MLSLLKWSGAFPYMTKEEGFSSLYIKSKFQFCNMCRALAICNDQNQEFDTTQKYEEEINSILAARQNDINFFT